MSPWDLTSSGDNPELQLIDWNDETPAALQPAAAAVGAGPLEGGVAPDAAQPVAEEGGTAVTPEGGVAPKAQQTAAGCGAAATAASGAAPEGQQTPAGAAGGCASELTPGCAASTVVDITAGAAGGQPSGTPSPERK